MTIRIIENSATPQQVYDLTVAFQRTDRTDDRPAQLTDRPTVQVLGMAIRWESPWMSLRHATEMLAEYVLIQDHGYNADTRTAEQAAADEEHVGNLTRMSAHERLRRD